jgi:light-regulated signal transduction histidine kinase (bacteriophytochrome)
LNRKLEGDVRDRTGELEASLVSLRESQRDLLRARDELERRVQERTVELQRSNHDLEQFAYVASHDLQEPLRAISGCVQIIERRYAPQLDAKAHELMKHTVEGVVRMKELIEGLLAYSRVTRTHHEVAPVAAASAVEAAMRHLQSGVRETAAEIVCRDLPWVMANQAQLTQLFQNLIGNALKYRSEERPRIEIAAQEDGGAMWQFSIRDNGIGIEPQYFERVFSIFQRLHTRDEYPGSGIGLAICKKIVERAGGTMWIESQLGQGSTFHFTLPHAEA